MQFKNVPVGSVFQKGNHLFVKNCNFPKLQFGKATEILSGGNPKRIVVHDESPVTRIIFNNKDIQCLS